MKPSSELLRLATAGSVDDGKSTLIGRLLHDTKSILEDQLEHVAETSERRGDGYLNLALLTDGLRAEREQGITIDVAYRYFQTGAAAGAAAIAGVNGTGASTLDPPEGFRGGRKFIIADTPGHEQYTRNMVTGASTADLSIVLVDARHGVSEQTRRHAYHRLAAADPAPGGRGQQDGPRRLRGGGLRRDRRRASPTGRRACSCPTYVFIPISALKGDNVVERSTDMPWYQGRRCSTTLSTW